MIRVYLYPKQEFPDSLINTLAEFSETEYVEEPESADVLLSYAPVYNQVTLSAIQDIRRKFSMPVLLVYEGVADSCLSDSVFRQDIAGIIRYASSEQLSVALYAVATGLRVFNQNDSGHHGPISEGMSLTPRELEILRLIADGEGNKSIAHLLEISEHTVKFHVSSIFAKLHVSSRTEAIKKGIQRGFISI
jgi:two-component system, NarL family, response regulator YdfI